MPTLDQLFAYRSAFDLYDSSEVCVTYGPTGVCKRYPTGVTPAEVIPEDCKAVAVLSENEILSLSEPLDISCTIHPILLEDYAYSLKLFADTLTFIIQAAVAQVFEGQAIEHVFDIGSSMYFRFSGMNLRKDDIDTLLQATLDIIRADLPITRRTVSYFDAQNHFRSSGYRSSLKLLESRNSATVSLACLGENVMRLFPGPGAAAPSSAAPASAGPQKIRPFCFPWLTTMLHSTAAISPAWFSFELYHGGLYVHTTRDFRTLRVGPYYDSPLLQERLARIMGAYKDLASALHTPDVASINALIPDHRKLQDFISVVEFQHEKSISDVARRVSDKVRCIFVAGPSSSSKTTFANRLSVHLRTRSLEPIRVSLDDFYLDVDKVPQREDGSGKPDFEHLEALDVARIRKTLTDLLAGKPVVMAHYDFIKQKSGDGRRLVLPPTGVLVVEGIHGLNDRLTEVVPAEKRLRIFIQPVGSLTWDENRIFESFDSRLVRRMCRDYLFRGQSAEGTLALWPAVRAGEDRWILNNQDKADVYFNSSILYELFVLRVFAVPLLLSVPQTSKQFPPARRLLRLLRPLLPVAAHLVPEMSLLCEFLPGGSMYEDFFF